jgi:hypothetical protein
MVVGAGYKIVAKFVDTQPTPPCELLPRVEVFL